MARQRTTYDEIETPAEMREDCAAVGRSLRLDPIARAAVSGVPSLEYAAYPREVAKRGIEIDEAASRLAHALGLDLD
jgi:hypothetical protein